MGAQYLTDDYPVTQLIHFKAFIFRIFEEKNNGGLLKTRTVNLAIHRTKSQ